MKVVFISPRFYPDIGGVEKHAFEVAKILSRENEITVITEGEKDKREKIKGIKVLRLYFGRKDWFRKFIIWWKILQNRKLIEKADVIHCHDVFFWYLPLRILYPGKKVFITFHGYETVYPPKLKSIFIRKLSEKLSGGNFAVGKYIEKWYGTKPNKVIYGAVKKIPNSKYKNNGKKLKILFIGRIEKDIGIEIYTDILKILKNFSFEVCGDGELRLKLEKFGRVHGFVQDLSKYIKKTDIVFASSYLSIFEAFSFKKPVISVYTNLLKEDYLKMTPFGNWLFSGKSAKLLANSIKGLNNKKTEKKVEDSYDWVKEQSWNKLANEYLKLWKA